MKFSSPNKLSQVDFLRLVAKDAHFTIADMKIIWDSIEKVFTECVETKSEVYLGSLGHLHYTVTKERTLPDPNDNGNLITRPESIRPILSLPMGIKQIVRNRVGNLPWKKQRVSKKTNEE